MTPPNSTGAQALSDDELWRIAHDMPRQPWGIGSRISDAMAFAKKVLALSSREQAGAVAWAAVHFGGKRDGKIYNTCDTREQVDAYIAQVHQSSDSVTLTARPLTFADAAPGAAVAAREQEASTLAEISTLLTSMFSNAREHVQGPDQVVVGYTVRTGALHKIVGLLASYKPVIIPSNLPKAHETITGILTGTSSSREEAPEASAEQEDTLFPFYELRYIMRVLGHQGFAPKEDWETAYGMAKRVFEHWHAASLNAAPEQSAKGLTMGGEVDGE